MISQEVHCKMKHEVQEAPVYQVFTFLAGIFFATMMPLCQVFINDTFFNFSNFFFKYHQGTYLLGFHQDNDFFQDFFQFLDFFQDL